MNNTSKDKRLDNIELQLTPKQWAIRLADEMRRYPSQVDYLKAIAKSSTFRQLPFIIPFYALDAQAEKQWPENIHKAVESSRKLRIEFQALKYLTLDIIKEMMTKAEPHRLRAELQGFKLHTLILEGAFEKIAICKKMLAGSVREALRRHSSLLEEWSENTATLLMEITAHKAAVQVIQEKYFESHSILPKDVEREIDTTIGRVRDLIAIFNEYCKDILDLSRRVFAKVQQKAGMGNAIPFERENSLPNDIESDKKCSEVLVTSLVEEWVKHANFNGTADILGETGMHEDFVLQYLRSK